MEAWKVTFQETHRAEHDRPKCSLVMIAEGDSYYWLAEALRRTFQGETRNRRRILSIERVGPVDVGEDGYVQLVSTRENES